MFVAFAMDTSGSVSDEHFKPYKEFIKGIIGGLDRGIGVALLHYDDEVYTDITFDDNQDRGHLIKVIESIEHTRGSTETQDALRASRELLNSPVVLRGHAVRVVCVFTDGKTFPNKEALIKPIAKLRVRSSSNLFPVSFSLLIPALKPGNEVCHSSLDSISNHAIRYYVHSIDLFAGSLVD